MSTTTKIGQKKTNFITYVCVMNQSCEPIFFKYLHHTCLCHKSIVWTIFSLSNIFILPWLEQSSPEVKYFTTVDLLEYAHLKSTVLSDRISLTIAVVMTMMTTKMTMMRMRKMRMVRVMRMIMRMRMQKYVC